MGETSTGRMLRHAFAGSGTVKRLFDEATLDRLQQVIVEGEGTHTGQVVLAIEGSLSADRVFQGLTPRQRALEVFGLLRVWDTESNNGVLIYPLLADHDVEIVADRAIHRHAGGPAWEGICERMQQAFRAGRFREGLEAGIREVSAALAAHFPGGARDPNELPDRPVIL